MYKLPLNNIILKYFYKTTITTTKISDGLLWPISIPCWTYNIIIQNNNKKSNASTVNIETGFP
jgi:hypothetical protein